MKHLILRKLMLIVLLLTGSQAFAHDFEVDGICYKILSEADMTVAVTYRDTYYSNSYSGDIVIPETVMCDNKTYSVTSIFDWTFSDCFGLTTISIPGTVTSIGYEAFYGCNSLTEITCESVTPPTINDNFTFHNVPETIALYVPEGSKEAYASATGWSYFTNILEIESKNKTTITIMDASNHGSITIMCEEGKPFEFTVTPTTGYLVNTVLVNGVGIPAIEEGVYKIESVSGETTISVSYELDSATDVSSLNANNIKVYGYDNSLTIAGAEYGDKISVYELNGTLVHTQNSVGLTNNISLDNNGIYLVKVNNKSFKVIL